MATGGYYIDADGLTELRVALSETAAGFRDLSKLYRAIGKRAELYVKTNSPMYAGSPKDSRSHLPYGFMQSRTRGGGGKTAYVSVSNVPYIFVQEFGGSAFWHRSGAGAGRAIKRAVRARSYSQMKMSGGHVIYTKPRRPRGYFIWNVAYRLRSFIGETFTEGLQEIATKHGLEMDIVDRNLAMEQDTFKGAEA